MLDPTFRMGVDEADIVIEEHGGSPRMNLTTDQDFRRCYRRWASRWLRCAVCAAVQRGFVYYAPQQRRHFSRRCQRRWPSRSRRRRTPRLVQRLSVDPALPPVIGQAAPDLASSVSEASVDQDTTLSHIYWTEPSRHKIQRANLDGSNIDTARHEGTIHSSRPASPWT